MRINQTIHELRQVARSNARCLACNHNPNKCEGAGCQLMLQAADQLELLSGLAAQPAAGTAEEKALFRMGQLDMQSRICELFQRGADNTHGVISSTLRMVAGTVRDLEVYDEKGS